MDEDKKIEAEEYNLKLYYDSIRKDLDIILTSTIPTQKNLMKTLLWINATIIGVCLTAFKAGVEYYYAIIPFGFSFASILLILISLKSGRVKSLPSPSIEAIQDITKNKRMKCEALIGMSQTCKKSIDTNVKIVIGRANKLSQSTNLTIISFIWIAIMLFTYTSFTIYERRNYMGNEDKSSEETVNPPSEKSKFKPALEMATNNSNIIGLEREIRQSIQKNETTLDNIIPPKDKDSKKD